MNISLTSLITIIAITATATLANTNEFVLLNEDGTRLFGPYGLHHGAELNDVGLKLSMRSTDSFTLEGKLGKAVVRYGPFSATSRTPIIVGANKLRFFRDSDASLLKSAFTSFPTTKGAAYEGSAIKAIAPDGVTIVHAGVTKKIPVEIVPEDLRDVFGLSVDEAKLFREQRQNENRQNSAVNRAPVPSNDACPRCDGKGFIEKNKKMYIDNPTYRGPGQVGRRGVKYDIFDRVVKEQCPRCSGSGLSTSQNYTRGMDELDEQLKNANRGGGRSTQSQSGGTQFDKTGGGLRSQSGSKLRSSDSRRIKRIGE